MNNVLQGGVDFLSAVFSLNGTVAEPSRSESACQAHLTVDTIENVIRNGGDCADGGAMARKQDELDGSMNCKPFIDGLLIKKAVSEKNRLFIVLNQKPRLRQECLPSIAGQDGTSSC